MSEDSTSTDAIKNPVVRVAIVGVVGFFITAGALGFAYWVVS